MYTPVNLFLIYILIYSLYASCSKFKYPKIKHHAVIEFFVKKWFSANGNSE